MSKRKKQPQPVPEKKVSNRSSYRWVPWLVLVAAFLLYAKSITFDYALDDGMYISNNKFVKEGIAAFPDIVSKGSLYGFNESNIAGYRPVTLFMLALEYSFFGDNPKGFHFINVLLYALLCMTLFNFLRAVFKDASIYLPLVITALFIVHPLHTEVVANIKSLDEILCMMFGVLSLHLAYRFVMQKSKDYFLLVMGLACLFLSVLSKESGYAFLGLLPLVLYFFTDKSLKQIAVSVIPFVAVIAISIVIRMAALDSQFVTGKITPYDNSLMAATNLSERLATNFTMMLQAIKLLIFPVTLSWDYSYNYFPVVSWSSMAAMLSLLIHLALLVYAVVGIRHKNIFSFVILFYCIAYFITSNLVINVGSSFGERFLFTPSLSVCIALPLLFAKLFKVEPVKWAGGNLVYLNAVLLVIVLLFAYKTVDRTKDWENNTTLLSSGLEAAPQSARAHAAYAKVYMKMAEDATDQNERLRVANIAIDEFNKAIAIYPRDFDIFYNLGVTYYTIGNVDEALKAYNKSLEFKPDNSDALNNCGVIYFGYKDYAKALDYFQKIIKLRSNDSRALGNAGACYQALQDTAKAFVYYEKALQYNPDNSDALNNIARLYENSGDSVKAKSYRSRIINH